MNDHLLPNITMVAGSTHPVSFQVGSVDHSVSLGSNVRGYFSVTPYVNNASTSLFTLEQSMNTADGSLNFEITSDKTVHLRGKYVYQVHLTNGSEHEIYQGYMVVLANRDKSSI